MSRPAVLIHGYSSSSEAFHALKEALEAKGGGVTEIALADYVSRDDTITFDEIARLFQDVIERDRPAFLEDGFDVIVHSTGALIARHWLRRNYLSAGKPSPVRHLVMLAPANFGSRLAHHGNSVLGRFASNRMHGEWQTGRHLLNGLELGSAFQWELTHADMLGSAGNTYAEGNPWTFVIGGNTPYSGMRRVWAPANEPGADGTVRIAAMLPNAGKVRATLTSDPPTMELTPSPVAVPLAVLAGEDHSSFVQKPKLLLPLIMECLSVENADDYARVNKRFADISKSAFEPTSLGFFRSFVRIFRRNKGPAHHAYSQLVVRAVDTAGGQIPDYRVDIWVRHRPTGNLNEKLTEELDTTVFKHVHTYGDDRSLRCFYIDASAAHDLEEHLGADNDLVMSIVVEDIGRSISSDQTPLSPIVLAGKGAAIEGFPEPNVTTLLEVVTPVAAARRATELRFTLS